MLAGSFGRRLVLAEFKQHSTGAARMDKYVEMSASPDLYLVRD